MDIEASPLRRPGRCANLSTGRDKERRGRPGLHMLPWNDRAAYQHMLPADDRKLVRDANLKRIRGAESFFCGVEVQRVVVEKKICFVVLLQSASW
jgi:hypothetical protein